jgi:hypothetical protein
MWFDEREEELLEHLTDPCPLGCHADDFNWWPIEARAESGEPGPGAADESPSSDWRPGRGEIYAYDCPTCGRFVVGAEEREWLLSRSTDFSLDELRDWLREESAAAPPDDYRDWPWLTHDLLLLFGRKLLHA